MKNTFSRRRFLQGAASVAGAAAMPASATPVPSPPASPKPDAGQLRGGELLPDPDFSLLREKDPFLIGIRPHRKGGVRLELEPKPLAGPRGEKHLIHNYGHGGAGITLSWGCASVVVDHVEQVTALLRAKEATPSIAILGTGVMGLTSATEIRRKWPDVPVTVYAKDLDLKTTVSFLAGGQFEPSGIHHEYNSEAKRKVLATYLRRARDRIVGIQKSGDRLLFGVAERKNYTLEHELRSLDVATPRDVVPAHRKGRLPFARLNAAGREYSTWLMNPAILLPKLASDLATGGVRFEQRTFATIADVLELPEAIVVNCTGYGAKQLFADDKVIAQRGHNIVLQKTDPKQFYFFSGGCENPVIAYVFCRQDDIVVGGTVQSGQDSIAHTAEDAKTFQRLLANARGIFEGRPAGCQP